MPANHQLLELLHQSAGAALYRARGPDGALVHLLLKKSEAAAAPDWRQLHPLLLRLDCAALARPVALIDQPGCLAMLFPDFEGATLQAVLAQRRLDVRRCLELALQLARALAQLHAQGLVHHDLRPASVLVAPDLGCIRLLCLQLGRPPGPNGTMLDDPAGGHEQLSYCAPEQTGRIDRPVDMRSDFYGLGVLLYRMLTGQLPFAAADALESVHCHIARLPPAACAVDPAIPPALSAVVGKLLAKNAAQRYQSASGLQYDLEHCLRQWDAGASGAPFAPGAQDRSERFHIPERLVGREAELTRLCAAHAAMAATGRPQWVLVKGTSGIGKSALVQALQRDLNHQGASCVAGKFEQYRREVPYAALAAAMGQLVRQALSENEASITLRCADLRAALGDHGQLMVDLIPQLSLLLGPQPGVAPLPPRHAQRRFQQVFSRLVGVFARADSPLTIFLDDLQWADRASLSLIVHLLARPERSYLMLIGAYRDDEIDHAHPLRLAMARAASVCVPLDITLGPLDQTALLSMVDQTLGGDAAAIAPLATLIGDKTGGNPFFVNQFLHMLHGQDLVKYDGPGHRWHWDMQRIRSANVTDNLVALMAQRLARLAPATQTVLQQAAGIGFRFDATLLERVNGCQRGQIDQHIALALQEGLLLELEPPASGVPQHYRWLHDRVQQAAYQQIAARELPRLHLRIGRALQQQAGSDAGTCLFDVANHLNAAASLVGTRAERDQLARLDMRAAEQAKGTFAYDDALRYLQAGIAMLAPDGWQSNYELAFVLHLRRAECHYLTGDHDGALELAAPLLALAIGAVDQSSVHQVCIEAMVAKGELDAAVLCGLDGLARFGIHVAKRPDWNAVLAAQDTVWQQLGGRDIDALLALPQLDSPSVQAQMHLLQAMAAPAYLSDENLLIVLLALMVDLSLRHGNSPASAEGYAWFGHTLGASLGQYQHGYRFARLGCALAHARGDLAHLPGTCMSVGSMSYWNRPLDDMIDAFRRAFDSAVDSGNQQVTCFAADSVVMAMLARGVNLDEVYRESQRRLDVITRAHFDDVRDIVLSMQCLIQNMRGLTDSFSSFSSSAFDAAGFEARLGPERWVILRCRHAVVTLTARFMSADIEAALAAADVAEPLIWSCKGLPVHHAYVTFHALALAAAYPRMAQEQQARCLRRMHALRAQLAAWTDHFAANFLASHALVSAEMARIQGAPHEAELLYEQAILAAQANGALHEQALACELAARFHRERGLQLCASAHLRQARACYLRWGAAGKVRQLDAHFPQMREVPAATAADTAVRLDVLAVVKASQAVSGHIVLESLLHTLMRTLLENAGAQHGHLLLLRGGVMTVVAEAAVQQQTVTVRTEADGVLGSDALPAAVLNYVQRSLDKIIISDAAEPGPFLPSDWRGAGHPQSVLCLPIMRQSTLIGLLYLENRLVTHAFTTQRLAVLELLASQAAIALENARLYAELQQENGERRHAEQRILHMAQHDALTGLANRSLLQQQVAHAIARAGTARNMVALLFIDLDNFKHINDSLGHHVGDSLLQRVAASLQSGLRESDCLARLGGDEFIVALPDLDDAAGAAAVADKLLGTLGAPFDVDGHELHVNASIGISMYPVNGSEVDTLMRAADIAMYHAKEKGRGNVQFFNENMHANSHKRLQLANQLRQALQRGELYIDYQPQVDMASAHIYSAEALLRWRHPQHGLVSPADFIPIAEQSSLILTIGLWVLRQACAQLRRWRDAGHARMMVAVNLSARQIAQPGFHEVVAQVLAEFALPPTALDLEITESMLMQPTEDNLDVLTRLSDMGVRLSIDDFGTGYSSLSYLKRYPVDTLKIDQSFVRGIGVDGDDMAITKAIIAMARSLRLDVIAEGVETADQAAFLMAHDCQTAQGYYYGRPLAPQQLTLLLDQQLAHAPLAEVG